MTVKTATAGKRRGTLRPDSIRPRRESRRSAHMIKQLAHLCFKTSRLEAMRAFYGEGLGATLKFRYLNQAGEMIGC